MIYGNYGRVLLIQTRFVAFFVRVAKVERTPENRKETQTFRGTAPYLPLIPSTQVDMKIMAVDQLRIFTSLKRNIPV